MEDKYKFKVNLGKLEDGLSDLVDEPAKKSAKKDDPTLSEDAK